MNLHNLDLGKSQSGDLVNDVLLPNWGKVFFL